MTRVMTMICLVALVSGCRAEVSVNDQTDGVRALVESYETYYNAGDANALARLYAADAVLLPPGRPAIRGREPIARFWQGGMGNGLTLESALMRAEGGVGFAAGAYRFPSDSGKFMLGAVRDETGTWRIAADIWNDDTPQYWIDDTLRHSAEDTLQDSNGDVLQ